MHTNLKTRIPCVIYSSFVHCVHACMLEKLSTPARIIVWSNAVFAVHALDRLGVIRTGNYPFKFERFNPKVYMHGEDDS